MRGLLVFLLFAIVSAVPVAAMAAVQVGKVVAVSGDVKIIGESSRGETPVVAESAVYLKDVVTTGADGKVKLLMKDMSVLTLGHGSKMVVREYLVNHDAGQRKSILGLLSGTLRMLVVKTFSSAGSKFEVRTPTAIAGARSTHYGVQVKGLETLALSIDGRVKVEDIGEDKHCFTEIVGGEGAYVRNDDQPCANFILPPALLNSFIGGAMMGDNKGKDAKASAAAAASEDQSFVNSNPCFGGNTNDGGDQGDNQGSDQGGYQGGFSGGNLPPGYGTGGGRSGISGGRVSPNAP